MRFQRFVKVLAVAALAWMAAPAWADTVQFQNLGYSGTYQGLVPGGIVIGTPAGSLLVPQGLSFSVAGQRVDLGSLIQGSTVFVNVPGTAGQVVGGYGNTVFVQYPDGVVPIPGGALGEAGAKYKVTVLKPNGKTVRVPLNAALNMQRSQGAVILGASPIGGWPAGVNAPAVVLGNQGEHLLLQTSVGGHPRLVRVPRSQAGTLTQVRPGTVVDVTPQGNGFGWGSWHPSGHGRDKTVGPDPKHGAPGDTSPGKGGSDGGDKKGGGHGKGGGKGK